MLKRNVSIALLGCLIGCAPTVKSAARQASRAAVDQSTEELSQGETKEQLKQTAEDPRVAEATAKMGEQIADGIVRSLASPETRDKLEAASVVAADAASRQLIRNLGSSESRAAFASLASAASDEFLTGLGEHVRNDYQPLLRELLKEDVVRGVAEGLTAPAVQASVTQTAHAAGLGAVSGVDEGLSAVFRGDTAGSLHAFGEKGTTWLMLLTVLAGLLALALLSGAIIVIAQGRRARMEVARLESAALLLASAVQRGTGEGDTREIVSAVRESLEHGARQKLFDFRGLRARPHH